PPMPMCVLGFAANENLFVLPDGRWADDTYLPNYIRRYPFVLAEVQGDDRLYLCADTEAEMIVEKNADLPFFNGDKQREVVDKALEFCRSYQEDVQQTQGFCAELKKLDLLRAADVLYVTPDGTQRSYGSVITIDYEKFEGLPDATFLDVRKRGMLPGIYF